MRLYDDYATQACACGSPKVIAGNQALRTYWIDHFKTYPVDGLAAFILQADGALVTYWTNNRIVQAQLIFNKQGKIAHVICGPADAQIRPQRDPIN